MCLCVKHAQVPTRVYTESWTLLRTDGGDGGSDHTAVTEQGCGGLSSKLSGHHLGSVLGAVLRALSLLPAPQASCRGRASLPEWQRHAISLEHLAEKCSVRPSPDGDPREASPEAHPHQTSSACGLKGSDFRAAQENHTPTAP